MSTTSAEGSPSPSPVAPNAPKFGTLVPNRIFVGGISASTTEAELHALFSNYGSVKATKIISDRAGVSKGYGFVTFETEEEARRIQKEADNIVLKDRKLNIAPAIRKQPFTRVYDPTQMVPNGTILYHNGIPYTYHNGMAFFTTPETLCQFPTQQAAAPTPPAYPLIYPQPLFLAQQQYQYQTANPNMSTQYLYMPAAATPNSAGSSANCNGNAAEMYSYNSPVPIPSSAAAHAAIPLGAHPMAYTVNAPHHDYADPAIIDAALGEQGNKVQYSKKPSGSYSGSPSKPNITLSSRTRFNNPNAMHMAGGDASARPVRYMQGGQPQLVAKIVNGVTVMAYSTPLAINSTGGPSHILKDHSADSEGVAMITVPEVAMIHQSSSTTGPSASLNNSMGGDTGTVG